MAAAEDFRVSARTGFLPVNANVRSTGVLANVIDQIREEPETLLTQEEAETALRISKHPEQIKPGEVIKMILGSEIVKVDHALVITKLREDVRRGTRKNPNYLALLESSHKISDHHLAALLTEFEDDMVKQAAAGTKAGSARSLFETMSAVAQCKLAGAIIKAQGTETAQLLAADVMGKGTGYTKCWLCGGLILAKEVAEREPASPECEHILPALSAAMFRGLFTQGATAKAGVGSVMEGKVDAVNTFVKMTANNYLWAHQICNANAKGAKFLIDYDSKSDRFKPSVDKITDLAQEIAMRVGQRNPWCLYGGTAVWGAAQGGGWGKKLKNLWSSGTTKDVTTRLPNNFAKHVRDILGYHWTGKFTNAADVHCGDRTGKPHVPTAMAGPSTPVTCYTAYNGSAFWYKDGGKYVIDIMLPQKRMGAAKKKAKALRATTVDGATAEVNLHLIKYNEKLVEGEKKGTINFGWKACYDVLMIEYTYHVEQIQKEYEEVKAKVKTDPGLKGEKNASFRVFAAYCLEMGRLYFLSKKGLAIGLNYGEMKYQGGGRRRRRGGVGEQKEEEEEAEPAVVNKQRASMLTAAYNNAAKAEESTATQEAERAIPHCFPIIFATQLYYTQAWSDMDYNIFEITNIKGQKGGRGRLQKGGNKTISQSRIKNFFTYLLLGNNTNKTMAVMNVATDSDALTRLWMTPSTKGGDVPVGVTRCPIGPNSVALPESLVAVTCQIMTWIFIERRYSLRSLKKYDPTKYPTPIGRKSNFALQAAEAAMRAQASDAAYEPPPAIGYYHDENEYVSAICCLLNAAFRYIEALRHGRMILRSGRKKLDDAAAVSIKKGEETAIGRSSCYRAILKKILDTFTLTNQVGGLRRSPRNENIFDNIKKCIGKYYKKGEWSMLGKEMQCMARMSFGGGGHKRTKKKRRRRHTRHRRRRHRRRKTRHRKQRRRRRRRTRR